MKTTRLLPLLLLSALSLTACGSDDDGPIPGLDNNKNQNVDDSKVELDKMNLVWNDEFDGTEVDTEKWDYRAEGTTRNYGIVDRSAVAMDGKGHVVLKTIYRDGKYYIAELSTEKSYSQTYGYFECRAKMNKSVGPHVAFWLQSPTMGKVGDPAANGAEIDIFEYHRKTPNIVYHNLHWNGYGADHQTTGYKYTYEKINDGDWHTFGLKWTPTFYCFYVDGKLTWKTSSVVSHRGEYMILSTELTGWGGKPEAGTYPDEVVFDYVRAYQFK